MCGIFCCVTTNPGTPFEWNQCKPFICSRGPDFLGETNLCISETWFGFFAASVLWMQGEQLIKQPASDSSGNVLLWNGDIFAGDLESSTANDTLQLLERLQSSPSVTTVLRKILGPYSFVYFQSSTKKIFFGRDAIGRHSLIVKLDSERRIFMISSVGCKAVNGFVELPSVGIFELNFSSPEMHLICHPWDMKDFCHQRPELEKKLGIEIKIAESITSPCKLQCSDDQNFPTTEEISYLEEALEKIYGEIVPSEEISVKGSESTIRLEHLQNGDVTKVAQRRGSRRRHKRKSGNCNNNRRKDELNESSEIFLEILDLLSENRKVKQRVDRLAELLCDSVEVRVRKQPRLCRNCIELHLKQRPVTGSCPHAKVGVLFSGGLDSAILAVLADKCLPDEEEIDLINVAFEKGTDYDVPDRKTGRETLGELRRISPRRKWNFVEVNVSRSELDRLRTERISHVLYPLRTILDESLGCAVWFASRACGKLSSGTDYSSPSRVLLLGMGADELFGGYTRHRTILKHKGWAALSEELNLELKRIAERNLGRDDRVVADNARQSRLPFLDENVVKFAQSLKPWERCYPTVQMPTGLGDKLLLRLLARKLGFRATASFPKRAFQFGSRIANSSENAKDTSHRL